MWIPQKVSELEGTIIAPPSKSYTHRALIISALCPETSKIENPLICYDTNRTASGCRTLKSKISKFIENNRIFFEIDGFEHWHDIKDEVIDIGESGTTGRFLISLASLLNGSTIFTGKLFEKKRPFTSLINALEKLGVEIYRNNGEASGHIKVVGKRFGEGYGTDTELVANGGKKYLKSSQYISSLLITCPNYPEDVNLHVNASRIVSKPYIDITLDLLQKVGTKIDYDEDYNEYHIPGDKSFKPHHYKIHGDYTQSAAFFALGALTDAKITITDLLKSDEDKQGDKIFIEHLKDMGAEIEQYEKKVTVKGPCELKNKTINCIDTPDLVPIYAVLGAFGKGTMRLTGISHLQYKESDRGYVLQKELKKAGIDIKLINNKSELIINHCDNFKEAILNDEGDHRMGMAFTILGLITGKIKVNTNDENIAKSYPKGRFLEDLRSVGAIVREK
ncbi:MAG: 3-phosphoshikimate 1-carboxyvinyltransferase [Candidatus Helarchaeota archaeon]